MHELRVHKLMGSIVMRSTSEVLLLIEFVFCEPSSTLKATIDRALHNDK